MNDDHSTNAGTARRRRGGVSRELKVRSGAQCCNGRVRESRAADDSKQVLGVAIRILVDPRLHNLSEPARCLLAISHDFILPWKYAPYKSFG
jgi:hypothetical protein